MRVALVHDWLTGMRGGERVLESFCELYPDADLFTLIWKKHALSQTIESHKITQSFISRLPCSGRFFRIYLPLFPTAIESFDLRGYDLILSSSHCVAKGVIAAPDACHIAYLHTPMRYVWDLYYAYVNPERVPLLFRWAAPLVANYLRLWDAASAQRVHYYIANSSHVAKRIATYYNRQAQVIHPPADTEEFHIGTPGDYYLAVGALVPYKRFDLAISACKALGRKLIVVGAGAERKRLQQSAGGDSHIRFAGWVRRTELAELYAGCRALLFPGEEDFGITPLEAMASGRPVVAYERGGLVDTLTPETGIFFREQSSGSLIEAMEAFEQKESAYDPAYIREYVKRFDRSHFKQFIQNYVDECLRDHHKRISAKSMQRQERIE